jgi:DNA repair protein RecO (recombination protein O)
MSLEYLTKGIPLFLRSASKDNTIVVLYTEDFGKVNLTIQSGQKVSSKLRPHVETAALVEVLYVQGKYFKRLIGAKRVKHYAAIWSDYNRLLAWKYFVEVFHQLVKIEYSDKQVYNLLSYSLELLNDYEYEKSVDIQFILNLLLYRLLVFLGQHSYSALCQTCHSEMEDAYLSFHDGNIICKNCRVKRPEIESLKKIPKHVLDIFNQLSNQKELNVAVTEGEKQIFIKTMEYLIKYFIDYPHRLKDFEYLD